jgi:hypothetical protein
MAFVAAPGIAQFNCQYTSYSDYQENVWHVLHTDASSWTPAQLTAMNTAIANWDAASLAPRRSTAFTLFKIHARDLSVVNGNEVDGSYASAGSKAGTAFPENTTIAVEKASGLSGRSNRGRVFHIGLVEGDVTNDRVSGTETAALVAAYTALRTAVNAIANSQLVVLSKKNKDTGRATPLGIPILYFALTDGYVDSQRRRLPGHNRHR